MSRNLACAHSSLSSAPSTHADRIGYQRPSLQQRATAAGKKKNESLKPDDSFPAPLVLPGDDLALDPNAPPQSLLSWVREKARNKVTPERNVLYIAGLPKAAANVPCFRRWSVPQGKENVERAYLTQPAVEDVMSYLAAFYHDMSVKLLPPNNLHFAKWDNRRRSGFIALNTPSESIGIRIRTSPDNLFQHQLNLDDLLDTAISILPEDAYALLMLVEHDLFEDDDDDFCVGRAYGGSRVAVVSMARYNPNLDGRQNVERQHAWPASHCEGYMRACCGEPQTMMNASDLGAYESPLQAAVTAHTSLLHQTPPGLLSATWLSRVCQTASHELGHCFGIDHCVYYACVMQSTASLAEDVRQPPYLCPVDLAKVLRATGVGERERYAALRGFCEGKGGWGFVALGAWIGGRVAEMDGPDNAVQGNSSSAAKMGSEDMPIEI